MPEDTLLRATVAYPRDHRRVIQRVRYHDHARHRPRQGRQSCFIRNEARREKQRRLALVQVGYFGFQPFVKIGIARNGAGPAAARTESLDGLGHRIDDERMLSHAEIVVRAPDRHLVSGAVVVGAGEAPAAPLQVREHPVAPFRAQNVQVPSETSFVILAVHDRACSLTDGWPASLRIAPGCAPASSSWSCDGRDGVHAHNAVGTIHDRVAAAEVERIAHGRSQAVQSGSFGITSKLICRAGRVHPPDGGPNAQERVKCIGNFMDGTGMHCTEVDSSGRVASWQDPESGGTLMSAHVAEYFRHRRRTRRIPAIKTKRGDRSNCHGPEA